MTSIPFPLRSNPAAVKFVGEPRLINGYAEEVGQEQKQPVMIRPIPGQGAFANSPGVPSRGAIYVKELDALYSLHGATLYKLNAAGTGTALTGFIDGSKPVIMERGAARLMQAEVEITIASPGVVRWPKHGLSAGKVVRFITTGELPTGLAEDTDYYVISAGLTADAFEVSATSGGSAINTSGTQTGTQTATRTEETYQVAFVSDAKSYVVEDDKIAEVDLPEAANAVTNLANIFVYSCASGRNYYSAVNDAKTVDAASYFTAESKPDGMVRAVASGGELYLLGLESTEIYQPSSDSAQPFVPLSGTFIDKGCASAQSVVASFDNAPHWLGHDGVVYRGSGYKAQRLNKEGHWVERAIAAVADKSTIRGYVDTSEGHAFYVLTCPQWTIAFDAATQLWHERKSLGRDYWRAWPYVAAFGKRIVGDPETGKLRELRNDLFTEDGQVMRVELTLPDVPGRATHERLELDVATGVGLNVAADVLGYEPKVMLSWSDDGGYEYGAERVRSLGRQGKYIKQVLFTRLGMARTLRGRRYRIAISDPVLKGFALADLEAQAA
jgi:hypothetical protein